MRNKRKSHQEDIWARVVLICWRVVVSEWYFCFCNLSCGRRISETKNNKRPNLPVLIKVVCMFTSHKCLCLTHFQPQSPLGWPRCVFDKSLFTAEKQPDLSAAWNCCCCLSVCLWCLRFNLQTPAVCPFSREFDVLQAGKTFDCWSTMITFYPHFLSNVTVAQISLNHLQL